MESTIKQTESHNDTVKLYSERSIQIVTFFGGPIAAGFLVSKNFKSLGFLESSKKANNLGIAGTLLLLYFYYIIPDPVIYKIPDSLIPFVYTGLISLVVRKFQSKYLKRHKDNGGLFYSNWKALWIAVLYISINIIGFIGISFMKPLFPGERAVYGDKKHEIYYSKKIDKELINKTANYLEKVGIFQNIEKVCVQIKKEQDAFLVRMPVNEQVWNDSTVLTDLRVLRIDLQEQVFIDSTRLIVFYDDFVGRTEKEIHGLPGIFRQLLLNSEKNIPYNLITENSTIGSVLNTQSISDIKNNKSNYSGSKFTKPL